MARKVILSIRINLCQAAFMEALPNIAYTSSTVSTCEKNEEGGCFLQLPITQRFSQ